MRRENTAFGVAIGLALGGVALPSPADAAARFQVSVTVVAPCRVALSSGAAPRAGGPGIHCARPIPSRVTHSTRIDSAPPVPRASAASPIAGDRVTDIVEVGF